MKAFPRLRSVAGAVVLAAACFVYVQKPAGIGEPAPGAGRPPIVGIANIALRVSNLATAQQFYGRVLGFNELPGERHQSGEPGLILFKVNDDQYIEVSRSLSLPLKTD